MLLSGFEGENINPICNYDMFTCGFHSNIGKGKLYVLPLLLKTHNKEYYLPILRQLFKIISSVDSELDLPKYLKDLRIVDESEIIQDKADYLERIEDINKKLNNYKIIKSILVLKHDLLVDNLIFTLKEIGLEVSRLERYEEDLWITKGGRKEVIVEVKGTKSNFTRKHLNDLDNHREENKLNDDVPALLIANTFSEANSLSEKDREPARGDTLRRTKAQKIMIMKSLDIFNLYLLIKSNKIEVEDFFTVLKGKECGCIKVNDKIELIKK